MGPTLGDQLAGGKLVLDHPDKGVARITIRNERRRGALDQEMLDALATVLAELDARCLVVRGSGDVFSAGYDIGDLDGSDLAAAAERLVAHPFHAAMEALENYPYPVVAQLNGHAIGGGLELAVTCDVRVAASGIKLAMPPGRLGLIYSHTGLRKFLDACGPAATAELFFTARNISAERGRELGLINHVVAAQELEEFTRTLARDIASCSPLSLRGNKRIIRTLRAERWRLPADVEQELVALRESCFRSEDFREGIRAFAEKRAPQWSGH
ncbi:enoyl-CoA hydratase/isomerase family protein [Thermoleophilum album]|uniref:enoyl-CoA hydratase/isomerase family protein n=1 Tax=Thermoleophilum album TaxID=29539 RepID=UPI00237CDC99|nr:enoyl-CoA hydratase-related protein [Thermoleophilum album]WDT93408.1 enoyl-CoA hydratase/isomerase family protein [Thermoleophilum album]